MALRPEYTRLLPKYDDSKSYHEFEESIYQSLMTDAPTAYDHLKTGVLPKFIVPALNLLIACAIRVFVVIASPSTKQKTTSSSAAAGAPPGTPPPTIQPPDLPADVPEHWISIPSGNHLPSWSSLNNIADADYKDKKYYYIETRNAKYLGAQGYEIWKDVKSCVVRGEYAYVTFEKKKVWSQLFNSIPLNYQDKITILPDYKAKLAECDYLWLWRNIKFAITGEGPQSVPLLFTKLMGTKMVNNDFNGFAKAWSHLTNEIKSRGHTGDKLVDVLFDAIFYMGLIGPSNSILKTEIRTVFQGNTWPPATDNIAKFSMLLTTLEKVESTYSGDGVIKANLAKTNTKKSTGQKSQSLCWNCGRIGHICSNCKAPVSVCTVCAESHHTLAHDSVKAAEARAALRNKPSQTFRDTKRVPANLTEASSYDDNYDDEQYDAMYLTANQAYFSDNEVQDESIDTPVDFPDEEPTESLFGFSAIMTLTHDTQTADLDDDSCCTDDDDSVPSLVSDYPINDFDDNMPVLSLAAAPATAEASVIADNDYYTDDEDSIPSLAATSVVDEDYAGGENDSIPSLVASSIAEEDFDDYCADTDNKRNWLLSTQTRIRASLAATYECSVVDYDDDNEVDTDNVVHLDDRSWNLVTNIPANTAINIHTGPVDIIAYLDSAAGGHIFLPTDRSNPMFTHVAESKGIVIEGVDENSIPIPVLYTGKHHVLGHCHFAHIRNRLIGIPKLLKKNFTMIGRKGNIIINDSNNVEVFNAVPDERGLYPVNLSNIFAKQSLIVKSKERLPTIVAFDGTLVQAAPKIDAPMSHIEIERAQRCRHLHVANGHPSNSTMCEALDNGVWPMIELTSRDQRNAEKLLGPCAGCTEGKYINPEEPPTIELRAELKGELLYMDMIKSIVRCLGGYTQALVSRDYVTSYITINGMTDKSNQSVIQAIISIIAFYLSYGHVVKVIVFDHEATFVAVENKLPGVRVQFTPTGMKNKHVERAIREIREKDRCTRANLPYELPAELEIESWIAQAESINMLPNTASGPNHTPFQLVTNLRPVPRPIAFGTAVLTYARNTNEPHDRAEWGLYLGQTFPGNSRVYLPHHKVIVSRRSVKPQSSYPETWKFIRRPKLITPVISPSVLDLPARDIDDNPGVNPLTVVNPITEVAVVQPVVESVQPKAADATRQSFPSIIRFIPTAITSTSAVPVSIAASVQAKAADVPSIPVSVQVPVAAAPVPEQRYNLRENPKPTVRYQANYSLPTTPSAYSLSYGKANRGIPVNNAMPCNVNIDKFKARIIACRISMRQALKDPDPQRATAARTAMTEELTQLVDSGTFDPKLYNGLSQEQRRRVIPSHMFFKDKFFADGRFQKLKARLVAGGNFVDTSLVGDISSWTVNPITVMMMLNMSALAQLKILTIDVKGAFLIPDLSDSPSDLTYVTIDKALSDEIVKIKPTWSAHRNPSGTFTMQLRKTLYGLGISSNRWMTHLNTSLVKLGFIVSPGDRCCFIRGTGVSKLIICSHVDDILCIGHMEGLNTFKTEFAKVYEINVQEGYKHSYIGLDIIQEPATSKVSIGQTGYRRDVLNRFSHLMNNSRNDGRVPCGVDIVEPDPPDCDDVDRTMYMSVIMSVMFLSRFTRPDLSFTVGMLSTHCTKPNEHHMMQAVKMLKYIANSPDMAIVFTTVQTNVTIFADASHATHHDGHGHGCLIIKLGSGLIYCRSYKLKLVTLSSTESEHVVLCDATTLSEWLLAMLNFMGINSTFVNVRQDNTSTIWLSENEGNFARNKHLLIRRNKAREGVISGIIKITYTPTEAMVADLGTKPLTLRQLLIHMTNIGMMIVTRPNGLYTLNKIVIPAARPVQSIAALPKRVNPDLSTSRTRKGNIKVTRTDHTNYRR